MEEIRKHLNRSPPDCCFSAHCQLRLLSGPSSSSAPTWFSPPHQLFDTPCLLTSSQFPVAWAALPFRGLRLDQFCNKHFSTSRCSSLASICDIGSAVQPALCLFPKHAQHFFSKEVLDPLSTKQEGIPPSPTGPGNH